MREGWQSIKFSVCWSVADIFVVKIWSCPKSRRILNLGGSTSTLVTFLFVHQSSLNFFAEPSRNQCRQTLFQFLIARSIPKIFAVKVESCPKSGRILDFLALPNFRGAGSQKFVPIFWPDKLQSFMGVLPLPKKLQAWICQILSQFWTPFRKNCKDPSPRWDWASKTLTFCSAGVSNSFGGAGHTARYHSVGGPHCF